MVILDGEGPSPRVRGAGHLHRRRRFPVGTIPAGAGSRHRAARPAGWTGDHPRGCGEQSGSGSGRSCSGGPSPRVRGADRRRRSTRPAGRTIPAGAGSSRASRPCPCTPRDHPRGCGEQGVPAVWGLLTPGPSPRVRGAALIRKSKGRHPGTIPAGAGSSNSSRRCPWRSRDHPRGCGEQRVTCGFPGLTRGPSPRVRGAVAWEGLHRTALGTIPAGAGSSCR